MAGASAVVLLALAARPWHARLPARAWAGAILVGAAFASYSASLNATDVVRAILLFYLAPVWSKIIERLFLGMPWLWSSTLALAGAGAGVVLLLGPDTLGGEVAAGDWLAIISGVLWSAGAALIFTVPGASPMGLTAMTILCTFLASAGFVLADAGPVPEMVGVPVLWPALALGAAYTLPIVYLTLWSAQRLAPATMSFLLTAELLSGVLSAAVWLDEPFGWTEAAGTLLILMAALAELLQRAPASQIRT